MFPGTTPIIYFFHIFTSVCLCVCIVCACAVRTVCVSNQEAGVCRDSLPSLRVVVSRRAGPVWGHCQQHQGEWVWHSDVSMLSSTLDQQS